MDRGGTYTTRGEILSLMPLFKVPDSWRSTTDAISGSASAMDRYFLVYGQVVTYKHREVMIYLVAVVWKRGADGPVPYL